MLLTLLALALADPPKPTRDPADLGVPFHRYTAPDEFGRTITFYLSAPPAAVPDRGLPLVLFVQGSGCQSLFHKHPKGVGGAFPPDLQRTYPKAARVLVVEKVGVKFLDDPPRPGSAEGASDEFLKEHTLPRWTAANVAAVRAALTLPGIDRSRVLAVGHSEGADVVPQVAAAEPAVTHVACLSGAGPTQLFDFVHVAAQPRPGDQPGDANRRVDAVYAEWAKVQADPDSTTKLWLGHPYRRWSSFLAGDCAAALLKTKAKVFLAHGTRDQAVPVASFDALTATLRSRGRAVTAVRIDGADHGYRQPDAKPNDWSGMAAVFARVEEWFRADGK